jgi:hypothetical protein
MIKLIVSDMDGTLLDSSKNINPEFWDVYKKIKEKGIIFCIASGRQYYNLVENFEEMKNDLFFIAENGGFVAKGEKEIYSKSLSKDIVSEIIDKSKELRDASVVLGSKHSAYIEDDSDKFRAEISKYYKNIILVDNFKEVEEDILKVAIYDFNRAETNSYSHYKYLKDKVKIIVSSEHWLDVMHMEVNKGAAVSELQKQLGISKDETLIFGDYMNDYEMMSCAKYSYAMANGHPKLIEKANFKAPSNDENGVVRIIKEYIND